MFIRERVRSVGDLILPDADKRNIYCASAMKLYRRRGDQ